MITPVPRREMSRSEFIVLIALMISIVAMATDVMLPALGLIATDLGQADPNRGHLVISILFAGFALGQLLAGPLSDSFGRRPVIHGSYLVFIAGTLLCIFAVSFEMMMLGRLLQGFGMAGPRIVAIAIVRDGFEGRDMARIMSFVMAVFIIVPAIAPAVGQVLIALSGWRATFVMLLGMGLLTWSWFAARQPETLAVANRRALSLRKVWQGIVIICRNPTALGYTLCAGFIFGPFLAYLSLAQQIFQDVFETGDAFVLWFGAAALSIGFASIVNSSLVGRLGMRYLSTLALFTILCAAVLFGAYLVLMPGTPPFFLFILWQLITFFSMGLLFGNLNAMAMEPLGKMAGLGAAVVGALSTFVSLPVGFLLTESFDDSVAPMVAGFGIAAVACLVLGRWVERIA
ncbi:multidrug effflux MFS transporter [Sulfitobacter sp. F26204]|uniref:multidrug effflux MFS transporter n=1 Tax=Sulfitobacter sp. F26204 TaxID=2996014 RepID=UPI00225DEBD4|nr:multidrug effflux MFS transporter [Sulfitobacter sp. F26204]MCX7559991.1 multidrug effflux MFS transporter [Sulfitobacter sp. F26204]